jgi:hypothetical protein
VTHPSQPHREGWIACSCLYRRLYFLAHNKKRQVDRSRSQPHLKGGYNKKRHLDRGRSRLHHEEWIDCSCLYRRSYFLAHNKKRHLDRSRSRSHRDLRSGETPAFCFFPRYRYRLPVACTPRSWPTQTRSCHPERSEAQSKDLRLSCLCLCFFQRQTPSPQKRCHPGASKASRRTCISPAPETRSGESRALDFGRATKAPSPCFSATYNFLCQKQPKTRLSSRKPHNSNKTKLIKMKFSYTQTHIVNL